MCTLCCPRVVAVPVQLRVWREHVRMLQTQKPPTSAPQTRPRDSAWHTLTHVFCFTDMRERRVRVCLPGKDRRVRLCGMGTRTDVSPKRPRIHTAGNSAGLRTTDCDCKAQIHFKAWFACHCLRFISFLYSSQPDGVIQCSRIYLCLHF